MSPERFAIRFADRDPLAASRSLDPGFDVPAAPDPPRLEDGHWCREVVVLSKLVDSLVRDSEPFGNLGDAHELLSHAA